MSEDSTTSAPVKATGAEVPKVHLWFRCPHCKRDWEQNLLASLCLEVRGAFCPYCYTTSPTTKVLAAKREYIGHMTAQDASARLGTSFQGVC